MSVEFTALMVKIGADITALSKGLDEAGNKMESWGRGVESTNKALATSFAVLGTAITASTTLAVREGAKFEEGMTRIGIVMSDVAKTQLPLYAKQLQLMSSDSGSAIDGLQAGFSTLVDAMDDPVVAFKMLDEANKLAIVSGSNMNGIIDGMIGTFKAYGLSAKDAQTFTDQMWKTSKDGIVTIDELASSYQRLAPVASNAGIPLSEVNAMFVHLTQNGVRYADANRAIISTINAFSRDSKQAKEIAGELGFTMDMQTLKEQGLSGAMKMLSGVADEQLGKLGLNLQAKNAIMKATGDLTGFEKRLADQSFATGEVLKDFATVQDTLNQQTAKLGQSMHNLILTGAEPLIPVVKSLVGVLQNATMATQAMANAHPALVASLGMLAIVLGPALLVLAGFLTMLPQLSIGIGIATQGLGAFIGVVGPFILPILALIGILGTLTKGFLDMAVAEDKARTAFNDMAGQASTRIGILNKDIVNYKNTYKDLTETEKEHIAILEEKIALLQSVSTQAMLDGKVTKEEADQIRSLTIDVVTYNNSLKDELTSRQHLSEQEAYDITLKNQSATQKQLENQAVIGLTQSYQELNMALVQGNVSKEQYVASFNALIEQYATVLGGTEKVIAKLNELDMIDPNINIKLDIFGMEKIEDVRARIRLLNQEIVLSKLEGDARMAQSTKFELENDLLAIATKKKAYEDSYNNNLLVLDQNLKKKIALIQETYGIESQMTAELTAKEIELYNFVVNQAKIARAEIITQYQQEAQAHSELTNSKIQDLGRVKSSLTEVTTEANVAVEAQNKVLASGEGYGKSWGVKASSGGGGSSVGGSKTTKITSSNANPYFSNPTFSSPVMTWSSGLSSWAKGTSFVPRDMIAQLHRGETVVTAEKSRGGGEGVVVITVMDESLVPSLLAKYPNAVLNVVNNDILSGGITERVIRRAVAN